MTHKNNKIESLKQNIQNFRLEAARNRKSLMLSLNRLVDAELENKSLVKS